MKIKKLTSEEKRINLLSYLEFTVSEHIEFYGKDHPITIDAIFELKKFIENE